MATAKSVTNTIVIMIGDISEQSLDEIWYGEALAVSKSEKSVGSENIDV